MQVKTISKSSQNRIENFVDDFIRFEYVQNLESERDSDFINYPERANRCYDAAEDGDDGKTHSEVIDDWRDAFNYWRADQIRGRASADPDRFCDAVHAYFDAVEAWHEKNGSLFKQVGY